MELALTIITSECLFLSFEYIQKPLIFRAGTLGVSLGASRTNVPAYPNQNFGTKVELTGKANLWTGKSSSLDLNGSASRMVGGFNHGANNFGTSLSFSHRFRG